jgi:Uma2 family endonuclease
MLTDNEWVFSATECEFAVEVTSPGQQKRDYKKANGYARAGVSTYLLVDQSKRECVIFTEAEDGKYLTTRHVPFGKPVELALYKTVTIDTSDF